MDWLVTFGAVTWIVSLSFQLVPADVTWSVTATPAGETLTGAGVVLVPSERDQW